MTNTLETNKPRQISYGEPALAIDFCPTYFCCSTPAQSDPRRSDGVGMRDAVKLACRLQRHGGGAVAGDSEAISVTVKTRDCTQRHFVGHLLPAQGLGVPCATGINDRRVTHKVCWVNVPAASRRPRRAGTSTVAAGVPPCQPRERSRFNNCAGSFRCLGTARRDRPYLFRVPGGGT